MSEPNDTDRAEEPEETGRTSAVDRSGGTGSTGGAGRNRLASRSTSRGTGAGGGGARALRRYGPIVAAAVVVVAAVAIFGRGDDDGDDGDEAALDVDGDELADSGPITFQRAEEEGLDDIDFGDHCDPETGRIELPTTLAAQCVEAFEGDNGGATSKGVAEDEILIVSYQTDPEVDPLASSIASGGGADTDPALTEEALDNYARLYNEVYETYGRTVRVERFIGTGASDNVETAKADAIEIADMEPFAVIGGPGQATGPFAAELAKEGIVCGPNCTLSEPESILEDNLPYMWAPGPTPDQAASLAAEMVGKLVAPGKAELAGDEETRAQDRVYALLHYDTPGGDHQEIFEALRDDLADNGVELATDIRFELDLATAQEDARTMVARLEEAGVTTVLYYGDPFTPGPLTKEATEQDYHPEWIMGPTVLGDSTFFARMMDGEQWQNGFGMSLIAGRGTPDTNESVHIYEWAFGEEPPANTVTVSEPPLRTLFTGIHLAGPELTPETFRDGLYRYLPSGGTPTNPQVSRGDHGFWPDTDLGGIDDMTLIWWDPDVEGPDEIDNQGPGMYRYANGGERYKLGDLPTSLEEAGLFDVESSVTLYEELPAEDVPPDYPSPELD